MNKLDISAINTNSPYSIWNEGDYYYFRSRYGVMYKVGFMEDFTIWEENAYQFLILNEEYVPSPNDANIKTTVFCIIEGFFIKNPSILLYLCETGDGKQASRNRLFIRWFEEYSNKHLYYFNTIELEADGIKNYAAIIVQKSNPKLTEIIKDFDDVIKILNDKPQ